MRIEIAPSLLSADFSRLGQAVSEASSAGADVLHFDIMDGHFVPNITFGPMVVRSVRGLVDTPFEAHLMISNPDDYIEEFVKAGANAVSVHVEACLHLHRSVQHIRSLGAKPIVVLNPATSISAIEEIVDYVDGVLIMTVNPGFGAQEFIESMLEKITRTRAMLDKTGRQIDLAVDGGINEETVGRVVEAGANHLIAGNSLFTSPKGVRAAIAELRDRAERAGAGWICSSSG
jgi:ribulose-phosphate 3-epimerase